MLAGRQRAEKNDSKLFFALSPLYGITNGDNFDFSLYDKILDLDDVPEIDEHDFKGYSRHNPAVLDTLNCVTFLSFKS